MHDDDTLFSPELLNQCRVIRTTLNKEIRARLMLQFADMFAREHDETDYSANDVFHQYLEEYETTKLAFTQAAMRLARMGMDFMEHVEELDEDDEGAVVLPPIDRSVN